MCDRKSCEMSTSTPAPNDTRAARVLHTGATVHRQPVVHLDRSVYGYAVSVLVRPSPVSRALDRDQVVHSAYGRLDLASTAGGAPVFVRATTAMLIGERPLPQSPGGVVVEAPRQFADHPHAETHLARLHSDGVRLALADYRPGGNQDALLAQVDFVKVDLQADDDAVRVAISAAHGAGVKVVAERVDTEAAVSFCAANGVELLQGPMFLRGAPPTRHRFTAGEIQCVELLRLLAAEDVDHDAVVAVVSADAELTIRVLHLVNASAFALLARIDSVTRAVVLLGPPALSALAASALFAGTDKTKSGLWFMLTRAVTCRALADNDAAYTVGLLSAVAAHLRIAPADLVARTGVSAAVAAAVITQSGPYGQVLAAVLAHEENNTAAVEATGLSQSDVAQKYLAAVADAFETVSFLTDLAV